MLALPNQEVGNNYLNYKAALLCLKQERLDVRRGKLALKFALKSVKSPRHSTMFPLNLNYRSNMRNLKPFKEYQCSTSRYFHSPIPYLARLLNKHHMQAK